VIVQWLSLGAGVLALAVAVLRGRRAAQRLERLQESYWDLRYETGQLQARVSRLETGAPPTPESPPPGTAAFVPLSSLKR
jgi:hypothetical protein